MERRGQRGDGRMPARIHARSARDRGGHGRSRVRPEARRQHAGLGGDDHRERPDPRSSSASTIGQGAQRPGNQANTSIGRFYRLFARNVPRFLPGSTDMATFGQMFRAVLAENERACAEMGWRPLHVTRGFRPNDSVVTITSVRTASDPFTTAGETAERHLDYIVDWVKRMMEPYQSSRGYVETHVLQLSPVIASVLAKRGVFEGGRGELSQEEGRGAGALLRMEHDAGRPSPARYHARRPGRRRASCRRSGVFPTTRSAWCRSCCRSPGG